MTDWGGVRAGIVNVQYAGNDLVEPGNAVNDVINASKQNPPQLEITGLPVYSRLVRPTGNPSYSWMFNGISPSATGAETITTVVDETTDLTKAPASGITTRDAFNNETFVPRANYASVDEAYNATVCTGVAATPPTPPARA